MKTKILIIVAVLALFSSCDTKEKLESIRYRFFIFKYTNDNNKDFIITKGGTINVSDSCLKIINGIANFPKRYRNEPYFGSARWLANPEKYTFNICELATEDKLLALHDNYYTYFPYTNIQYGELDMIRNGKWENICDTNPLNLPIIGDANSIYSEIRSFKIQTLEKISQKSRTEMTIEDIITAINVVIDNGQLGKYSQKTSTLGMSME